MRQYVHLLKKISLLIIVVWLVSCTPQSSVKPTTTHLSTIEPGQIHSITDSPSIEPSPTLSFNFTPTLIPTLTITPIPELSTLPTLSDADSEKRLVEWLGGTSDCLFPCWAGITPGKSNWQESKQILESTVKVETVDENIPCTLGQCNEIQWTSRRNIDINGSIVSRSSNIIYAIFIKGQPPASIMRVDRILTLYGKPDKVFVEAYNYINPDIDFTLTLSYPNHQFIIQFNWYSFSANSFYTACVQDKRIQIFIQPVEEEWTDDFVRQYIYGDRVTPEYFRPLEKATGMTVDQFYEKFKTIGGNGCISTPAKDWP